MIKVLKKFLEVMALASPKRDEAKALIPTLSKLLLLSFIVGFTGCGDEPKEVVKQAQKAPAPKIEIVANENAKEVKVAEHKKHLKDKNDTYYYDYNIKSAYDQNAQPANRDASVRTKPRTAIEANMNIRSPYEDVQIGLLVGELSKHFRVKCSACHSDYANGVIGPSLLTKTSDDIFNAIADFKSGKKSNPLMDGLISQMDDKEIRELADEIYTFNQKLKEMRSKK
jgi:cytochrome c553